MWKELEEKYRIAYPGTGISEVKRMIRWRMLIIIVAGILLFTAIVLFPTVGRRMGWITDGKQPAESLSRNGYGSDKEEKKLSVEGLTDHNVMVTVDLNPKNLTQEEADALFAACAVKLKAMILGENQSLNHVTRPLEPVYEVDGIDIMWTSSNPFFLDNYGNICISPLEIPVTGADVKLFANMELDDFTHKEEIPIHIDYPFHSETEHLITEFEQELAEQERDTRGEFIFELPQNWNGRKLSYEVVEDETLLYSETVFPLILIFILLAYMFLNKPDWILKERKRQIAADYAGIVSQMDSLILAGYPIRNAWGKIVEDYEERKKKSGKKKVRFAYEEMAVAQQKISFGQPELIAYHEFAQSCANHNYDRFVEILENSIVHGKKDTNLLKEENIRAGENRRNLALRKAQEAETKILLPMILMFAVVLAVLLIPTLLGM